MMVVVSSIFQVIKFIPEGSIVTIDHLSFHRNESTHKSRENIPLLGHSVKNYENIGVRMYPTLMETFNLPPPNLGENAPLMHVISYVTITSTRKLSHFKTSYFEDPWIIP